MQTLPPTTRTGRSKLAVSQLSLPDSSNEEEITKLLRVEEERHQPIVSQEKAISVLARAIRRSRAGLKATPGQLVRLFLGPTGVGTTELARALASFLFGGGKSLIRFDMSEFMEKYSVLGFSVPMGEGVPSKIEDMVCGEVKRAFNPEFLNRLDDIILFTSLVDEDLLAPMSRRAVTPRGTPLICS